MSPMFWVVIVGIFLFAETVRHIFKLGRLEEDLADADLELKVIRRELAEIRETMEDKVEQDILDNPPFKDDDFV